MVVMNIQQAKAQLSALVAQAEQGQQVVIARAGRPVVRLVQVEDPPRRRLGVFATELSPESIAESLAPLSADEVDWWDGPR
jgi:prevent-host-death family protein